MNKKVCVITGANSGIGKAAAVQIAQKGYHVVMACRSRERSE
ncbi:MAG: SDR family NAD(P)-dependent oxidoreductase, partial [Anaerolineales bacterium]|nr:SDR family NAD(P)-dependent oxidoreductase [Anaerolineales bacterium]